MTRIIHRHDTSTNWTSVNPTLSQGEFGVETDTGKFKIGDGQKAWNSLPYASSGGAGGSGTQITSADGSVEYGELALGDTLAVENGVLNANLDEIGNEVNTLAGRVTSVEGEVAKKEDVITAIKPITLEKKVISTLTGISETDSVIQTINRSKIDYLGYQSYGQYYNSDSVYLSNIIQPYTFGQVVKYPYNNDMLTAVLFGHPTENKNGFAVSAIAFPCASQQYSGYDADYKTGGININGCTELPTSSPASKNFSTSAAEHAANVSADKVDGYCYAQIIVGGDGELILGKYGQQYSLGRGILSTDVFRDGQADVPTGATASAVAGITHVMWIFGNANTIYNKSLIGLYDVQPRMPWNFSDFATFEAGLGENLLDLSSNVSQNYLQLDIGDGLSVVDGKLTATSSSGTPENMVTTDTAQNITGVKNFTNGLKSNGYIADTGLTELCYTDTNKNPHVGNVNRTLTIHTNPISKSKVIIDNGSGTSYDLIHSGNISDYVPYTITKLTQSEYDALVTKDDNTMYVIVG